MINQIQLADAILKEFKELPNSWQAVGLILEKSKSTDAKFLSLGILLQAINVRISRCAGNHFRKIKGFQLEEEYVIFIWK